LPPSTAKRVILYRFDRLPAEVVINPSAFLLADGVEWITLDGKLQSAAYGECKAICFTIEGGQPNLFSEHSLFERRPKVPGLWTRFTFRDGEQLDGILSHNLLEWPESGYSVTPPRSSAVRQRVYIPRAALSATELRGVVGSPIPASRRKTIRKENDDAERQLSIFAP
jgi:hypothetical protein